MEAKIEAKELELRQARGRAPKPGGGYYPKERYSAVVRIEGELQDLEAELAQLRGKKQEE